MQDLALGVAAIRAAALPLLAAKALAAQRVVAVQGQVLMLAALLVPGPHLTALLVWAALVFLAAAAAGPLVRWPVSAQQAACLSTAVVEVHQALEVV